MRILDCYIENFGKLSDFKLSFSGGLNSVVRENGYGKTTLTVFIKAMLYGLDTTKRTKLENNDRRHYMPWHGGRCGGSLTFEANGKEYRIERTFMPKASEDEFRLFDCKSGKESYDFSENVGEELFGIDVDGFERTVFLSEANLSGKNENKTVSAKLSNLVGCDGDLSVMDDAIELLEKQRRVYYKRGGAGEIGDIKTKVGALEREIYDLERKKVNLKEEEARLFATGKELEELYERKAALLREARLADEARIKRTYVKQYRDMMATVERDEESKRELEKFFALGVPSGEEIEIAKECYAESRRILSTQKDSGGVATDFSAYCPPDVDSAEYERIRLVAQDAERARSEYELLVRNIEASSAPEKALPSVDKIDEHIKSLNQSRKKEVNKSYHITFSIGAIFSILGIIVGVSVNPAAYTALALGILLILFGAKNFSDLKKCGTGATVYDMARDFIQSAGKTVPTDSSLLIERLYELRAEAQSSSERLETRRALELKAAVLRERLFELERTACEFISRFPKTEAPDISSAIADILHKRSVYLALAESRRANDEKRCEELAKAREQEEIAKKFLARFPTVTERPFEEISSNLTEYTAILRSIDRMKVNLAEYARTHGIDPSNLPREDEDGQTVSVNDRALDEKIAELERARVLSERQCRIVADEVERIDELTAERDELLLRAQDYEARLSVIRKTKELLVEAKDSLTSRYLSKTKAAFDGYIALISREPAEDFKMDTSFSVMKNERGSLKDAEAYSRGMRDLYALAARFALIDSLYENENPFVILDDPFAYFDDERLARARAVIKSLAKDRQIIYLTCSDSRKV